MKMLSSSYSSDATCDYVKQIEDVYFSLNCFQILATEIEFLILFIIVIPTRHTGVRFKPEQLEI